MEDVRLLCLSGLSLWSVVSCCMAGDLIIIIIIMVIFKCYFSGELIALT